MIRFKRLWPDVIPPKRAHDYDAAFDVHAYRGGFIQPQCTLLVQTGLVLSVPPGYVIMVLPRSGLANKHAVTVANAPGLVDPGYRGELGVCLINNGFQGYEVEDGDRVAQLLVVKYAETALEERADLHPEPDARGTGGFGSTGR